MRTTNKPIFFSLDSLTIYDGASSTSSIIYYGCGDSIPQSHVSSSNEVLIHFQSDYSATYTGFKMEYNPLGNTSIKPLNIIELKGVHSIIFVLNIFPNYHLIQKCIRNQQLIRHKDDKMNLL